jgi:hypothetical protein
VLLKEMPRVPSGVWREALRGVFPDTISLCPDSCVTLIPALRGGVRPFRYVWSPVDPSQPSTDSFLVVCPRSTTTYSVTVTDADGCTVTAQVVVRVGSTFPVTLSRRCGELFASPDSCEYRWFLNGQLLPGERGARLALQGSGIYAAEPIGTDGCASRATLPVSLQPLDISVPDTLHICRGACVTLPAALTGGTAPFSCRWTPAAGLNNPFVLTPRACPDTTTMYTLVASDSCGETARASVVVAVHPLPVLYVLRRGDTLIAMPPGLRYRWYRNGVLLAGETGQTHLIRQSGSYTVEGTAAWGCAGLSDTAIVNGFVLLVALPDSLRICPDSCVQLRPVVTGGAPPLRYHWTPAKWLSSAVLENPVACPDSAITYTLEVVDSLGNSARASVAVMPEPRVHLSLLRSGDTLTVWPAGLDVQWYRNGALLPGASGQQCVARLPGTYTAQVRTRLGCPASASIDIAGRRLLVALSDTVHICADSCVRL